MEYLSQIQLGMLGGLILFSLTLLGGLFFLMLKNQKIIKHFFDADFFVGFMISASAFGLILPAYGEVKQINSYITVTAAIALGAITLIISDLFLQRFTSIEKAEHRKSIAFFAAMALHNLPEGLAAGASLSHSQSTHSFSIISAIGIQNIPEGFTTGISLLSLGTSPLFAFLGIFITGLVELFGGFLGGILNISLENQYPAILAFAGGAMMKVAINEIFEKIISTNFKKVFNRNFILGFFLMTLFSL